MFVTVKHLMTKNIDLKMDVSYKRGQDLVNLVNENKNEYVPVAQMYLSGTESQICSKAYELTNHIDCSWTDNRYVSVIENEQNKYRSTSIGDVISVGDQDFVVDSFGFTPLD